VKFAILNLDENKIVASREGVSGTPTLFFYRNGRLEQRLVGVVPRADIARHLDSLLARGHSV
jgi:thioredoxin 2